MRIQGSNITKYIDGSYGGYNGQRNKPHVAHLYGRLPDPAVPPLHGGKPGPRAEHDGGPLRKGGELTTSEQPRLVPAPSSFDKTKLRAGR